MYIHLVSAPNRHRHIAGITMMSYGSLVRSVGCRETRCPRRRTRRRTADDASSDRICISLPNLCTLYPRLLPCMQPPHLLGQCGTCPRSEDFKWIDVLTLSSDTTWEFPPISSVPTYLPTVSKTLRTDCCEACFESDWLMRISCRVRTIVSLRGDKQLVRRTVE